MFFRIKPERAVEGTILIDTFLTFDDALGVEEAAFTILSPVLVCSPTLTAVFAVCSPGGEFVSAEAGVAAATFALTSDM